MDLVSLRVGDRFFSQDYLVTMQVTDIWCKYNEKEGRWESWVEYGSVRTDGLIHHLHKDPAWDFLNSLKGGNYEYRGRKNPVESEEKVRTGVV